MKVFYTPQMTADSESYSPSASKPTLAVADWLAHGLGIEVVKPEPATRAQFYRAHDRAYVDGVLACRKRNGFGNCSEAVGRSLPYTSGAMIAAAREAVRSGGFACAPVSGFHHACWDHGGVFCTFNGLMVAALDLLGTGDAKRVGILDCDQHYGNGTDDIIRVLGVGDIVHRSVGAHRQDAEAFLRSLPGLMRGLFADCDVLLYQAGADPHIDDPLGGWMTTEELAERDRLVFGTARELSLPMAWNLAGGYQRDPNGGISKVLEIHSNTMRACLGSMEHLQNGPITPQWVFR